MKLSCKLIGIFFLCTFLSAIAEAGNLNVKKIAKKYDPNDVIYSLIMYYEDAPPKKSVQVANYIYDYDYSNVSYNTINRYAQAAQYNAYIEDFFNTILEEKKAQTLDELSKMSLEQVADFYNKNSDKYDFLQEVLRDVYFSNLDSLDYHSLKTLYQAFKTTDFSSIIEAPYMKLRNSLLMDIMAAFDPCFKSEKEILKQIEDVVRYEVQQYLDSGLHTIVHQLNIKNDRGMFKKIFKREAMDNYSFKKYANETINKVYNYSYIERLIKERIVEYLSSSKEIRSMLFNQYFNDVLYDNIYISNDILQSHLVWEIGRQDVNNIQSIKNMGTALTVGSVTLGVAAGIVSAGALAPIAFVADVADFAYGMGQDSQINKAMEALANTIYQDSSMCLEYYINDIFSQLYNNQEITANNIKKIFYEEF